MTANDLLRHLGPAIASDRRRADLMHAVAVGLAVFVACLVGILSRDSTTLATFWPANALMLGLLLRNPERVGPWHWTIATVGFMAADLITGSAVFRSLLLTSANLAGVAAAFILMDRLDKAQRLLQTPTSILVLCIGSVVAALAAAACGALVAPIVFGGTSILAWRNWFVAELVNFCALLPLILTFPTGLWRNRSKVIPALRGKSREFLPAATLLASILMGSMIGGFAAVTIPIPALLWCAMRYPLWVTAVLVLGFNLWAIFVLSRHLIALLPDIDIRDTLMSIRVGLVFISLAPLSVAGITASRNELLRRLQHMAECDQLTGLLNRRGFETQAVEILSRSAIGQKPVALLMLDLDRFKLINDEYGHAAGDAVLAAFAERARCIMGRDLPFGRLGGEEFACMLENCTLSGALALASAVRAGIADLAIDIGRDDRLRVTISIGVAHAAGPPRRLENLLTVADRALYRAKRKGRDRVESEELLAEASPSRRTNAA